MIQNYMNIKKVFSVIIVIVQSGSLYKVRMQSKSKECSCMEIDIYAYVVATPLGTDQLATWPA